MKKNELKNLHNKTIDELKRELKDRTSELSKSLFEAGSKKLKNTAGLKTIKKNRARIKTILHMKMEGVATHDK